mmetsp:Transcript_906/g.5723  ORF Transcript_906/g.5723 Transcript_906/m.5723 type:complete len:252 (-) Transcript_906:705-1460(-)
MGDVFKGINNAVRVVIRWINAPLVTNMRVRCKFDTVCNEVKHIEVFISRIHLQTQSSISFTHHPSSHVFKQLEGVLDWSISPRTTLLTLSIHLDFFCFLMADICLVLLDQLHCKSMELFKVITGVCDFPRFPSQPANNVLDVINELQFLCFWIGIIKSEVAHTSSVLCHAEVNKACFGMSNVKVSVRFWWKSSLNPSSSTFQVGIKFFPGVCNVHDLAPAQVHLSMHIVVFFGVGEVRIWILCSWHFGYFL